METLNWFRHLTMPRYSPKKLLEVYQKPIRNLSETYQKFIRNLLEVYQKLIRS